MVCGEPVPAAQRKVLKWNLKKARAAVKHGRWDETGWTLAEDALLGTDPDEAIAKKIGQTLLAVGTQWVKRGIPAFSGRPGDAPSWKANEEATRHDSGFGGCGTDGPHTTGRAAEAAGGRDCVFS
jgi:hypothetical protein